MPMKAKIMTVRMMSFIGCSNGVDDVDIVEALEARTIGAYPCFVNSLNAWTASRLV